MALARAAGINVPYAANTAYVNTIPPERQPPHPGDRKLEMTIRRYVRWNATAIVLRANADAVLLGVNTLIEETLLGPRPRGPVFRIMDPELRRLRQKLGPGAEAMIETVRSVGYKLRG